jgi:hypothetical protein
MKTIKEITMKKLSTFLVFALALGALLTTSCKSNSNNNIVGPGDITPANTDWEIMFFETPGGKAAEYSISVNYWQEQTDILATDTFHMMIDDVEVPLTTYNFGGYWSIWGTVELNPGQTYAVKLYKNDTQITSANLMMPYNATATFPTSFDPAQSTSFSWTLSNNNQYQFAGASAYQYVQGGDSNYDDAIEDISPSARSHTVPANGIQDFGAGTWFELLVGQMNYVRNGRNAFEAYQDQYTEFETKASQPDLQERIARVRRIIRMMQPL